MKNYINIHLLFRFCLVAGLALVTSPLMAAATYYVAKTGSDSNAGTNISAPFLTIQKAASVMLAGDTCYIRKGIYRETVTPVNSGTSAASITFSAYPGDPVIISGADVL